MPLIYLLSGIANYTVILFKITRRSFFPTRTDKFSSNPDLFYIIYLLNRLSFTHSVIIKVNISAGFLCCKVEQPKAVSHKVGHRITHLKGVTKLSPVITFKLEIEQGLVIPFCKITVDFESHFISGKWHIVNQHRLISFAAHHHYRLLTILHPYTDKAIDPLESDQSCIVSILHSGSFNCNLSRTGWTKGALSKYVL